MFCKKCGSVLSFSSQDRLCPVCRKKKKYAQSEDEFDYIEKAAFPIELLKAKEEDKTKLRSGQNVGR